MSPRAKSLARRVLGDAQIRRAKARRMRLAEALGSSRWSRPGLAGLDVRLVEQIAAEPGGTFIEFGANDGLQQSNTYLLERELGWRGVLIEPVPALAAECALNRPLATVICAAVSRPEMTGHPVGVADHDLMSTVSVSRTMAGGVTLDAVIETALDGSTPDLIVVDVEGHEIDALAGLDLAAHAPKCLLIETSNLSTVATILAARYDGGHRLSHHDHLFTRRDDRAAE